MCAMTLSRSRDHARSSCGYGVPAGKGRSTRCSFLLSSEPADFDSVDGMTDGSGGAAATRAKPMLVQLSGLALPNNPSRVRPRCAIKAEKLEPTDNDTGLPKPNIPSSHKSPVHVTLSHVSRYSVSIFARLNMNTRGHQSRRLPPKAGPSHGTVSPRTCLQPSG